jgi:hypothetical protein
MAKIATTLTHHKLPLLLVKIVYNNQPKLTKNGTSIFSVLTPTWYYTTTYIEIIITSTLFFMILHPRHNSETAKEVTFITLTNISSTTSICVSVTSLLEVLVSFVFSQQSLHLWCMHIKTLTEILKSTEKMMSLLSRYLLYP